MQKKVDLNHEENSQKTKENARCTKLYRRSRRSPSDWDGVIIPQTIASFPNNKIFATLVHET
jgi:hypothetical protein